MTETFFYLETTGRVSGDPHKIEIWFVEHDGCYYMCSGGGEKSDWVKNLIQSPFVRFATGTSMDDHTPLRDGLAIPIADEGDRAQAVKRLFDGKYNWSNGLIVQVCPAGS